MRYVVTCHGLFARLLGDGGLVWTPNRLSATHTGWLHAKGMARHARALGFGTASVRTV